MARKIVSSDAMSKIESTVLDQDDGPEALGAAMHDFAATMSRGPLERVISSRENAARELMERGFSDPLKGKGWADIAAKAEPLSDEAFLARIIRSSFEAEHALKSGNPERIFMAAMRWALAMQVTSSRRAHLKNVTTGAKQNRAGNIGREIAKENSFESRFGADAREFAKRLIEEKPTRTWGFVKRMVAEEFKVSERTAQASLGRDPRKLGNPPRSA